MTKMNHILAALVFASLTAVQAQAATEPVTQGAASVNKNLANDPDNKGLQNASEKLTENEAKVAEKRAAALKTSGDAKMKREAHQKMEKHGYDRAGHPDRIERPGK